LPKKGIKKPKQNDSLDAVMGKLSASLLGLEDRPSIMRGIAETLVENLGLRSAYVFAFYNETASFQLFKTDMERVLDTVPASHLFFQHFKEPIAPTLLNKLPIAIQLTLRNYPFFPNSLIYTVHSFGTLQGLFVLSPKENGKLGLLQKNQ